MDHSSAPESFQDCRNHEMLPQFTVLRWSSCLAVFRYSLVSLAREICRGFVIFGQGRRCAPAHAQLCTVFEFLLAGAVTRVRQARMEKPEMTAPHKHAVLYRMVMPEHLCPFGLKSRDLLKREGYSVDDQWLRTREQTDEFKRREGVDTTPQTYIDGQRIGGYDDVRRFFGKRVADPEATQYRPVLVVFAVALLMALAGAYAAFGTLFSGRVIEWFLAMSMTLLGMLKLRDVEGFSNMFLGYDLLAQRVVPYAYVYPYGETLAGLLMVAGALIWLAAPLALVIGTVGAVSVFKAVYIDKRELRCACVGGDSNVPLGFVSLTENLVMVGMGVWMLLKP